MHGKEAGKQAKLVLSDTTVQENNTTFPTDAKLCKRVMDKCNKIAEKEGINQRQKFTRESKELLRGHIQRQAPQMQQTGKKSKKRLKTIANKQLRELDRKMTEGQKAIYKNDLERYKQAVNQ